MEFDSSTWTPLYRLVMGEPGQSHALETARRYGLPESVLQFARELLGDAGTAFAGIIDELRQKRNALTEELNGQQAERQRLEAMAAALHRQEAGLALLRQETIEKARQEARDTVTAARRELNQLLDQFRQDRRKETAGRLRERAEELEAAFAPSDQQPPDANALKPGSVVYVRSLGRDASIVTVDLPRQKARVRAGSLELEVPLHGLAPKQGHASGDKAQRDKNRSAVSCPLSLAPCPSELNLIGTRVEDALTSLEGFIDHAMLAGQREIRIVHGIGTGALLRAVREFLARHPQVTSFRPGEPHEGRDGATIVELA
jgi:DNA mismatch repair protein MutS2